MKIIYQRCHRESRVRERVRLGASILLLLAAWVCSNTIGSKYLAFEASASMGDSRRLGLIAEVLDSRGLLVDGAKRYFDRATLTKYQNIRTGNDQGFPWVAWEEYLGGGKVRVSFADRDWVVRGRVVLDYADYGSPGDFDGDGNWEVVIGYRILDPISMLITHYEYAVIRMRSDGNEVIGMIDIRKQSITDYSPDPIMPIWCDSNLDGVWELYERQGTRQQATTSPLKTGRMVFSWRLEDGRAGSVFSEINLRCEDRLPIVCDADANLALKLSEMALECDD